MIAFLGVIVGGIVVAMYLPIFDLYQQAGRLSASTPPWLDPSAGAGWFGIIWARVFVSTLLMGSAVISPDHEAGLTADRSVLLPDRPDVLPERAAMSPRSTTSIGRAVAGSTCSLPLDACTVTAFIYFTGGVTSYFALLYVLPIIGVASLKVPLGQHARGDTERGPLRGGWPSRPTWADRAHIGGLWMHDMRPLLPRCAWPLWPSAPTPSHWWRWRCSRDRSLNACRAPTRGSRDASLALADSAGLQPARHRQHDERSCHHRSRGAHPHVQPRRRSHHRPRRHPGRWDEGGRRAAVSRRVQRRAGAQPGRRARAARRLHLSDRRWRRRRHRPQRSRTW